MYNINSIKGNILRGIHILIIILTISIPLIPNINKKILVFNTILLVIILIFFIINNGCIISRYERLYLKDQWTPIDILCNILYITPTPYTRKIVAFNFVIFLLCVSLIHIFIKDL